MTRWHIAVCQISRSFVSNRKIVKTKISHGANGADALGFEPLREDMPCCVYQQRFGGTSLHLGLDAHFSGRTFAVSGLVLIHLIIKSKPK